jgi:hypothetical protein
MRLLGASTVKDLTPDMVGQLFCFSSERGVTGVLQVERVDWQPLIAKL